MVYVVGKLNNLRNAIFAKRLNSAVVMVLAQAGVTKSDLDI